VIAATSRRRVRHRLLRHLLIDEGAMRPTFNADLSPSLRRLARLLGVARTDIPYTLTPEWEQRIRVVLPQLIEQRQRAVSRWRKHSPRMHPETEAHLDAVRAEVTAQLQAQFDERVQQAADARVAERTARLDRWEQELRELELRLRARQATVVELMSYEEFQLIRSVLHPDRAPADRADKYARAFQIFQRLEATANPNSSAAVLRQCGWEHLAPFRRNGARAAP
jgi:hypothetical protein